MPLLVPDIVIQTYRKKELIVIKVPHAAGPYYLKSAGVEKGAYIRLGSTNRVADKEALQTLRDFAHNIYFDTKPHLTSKANDLDWEVIDSIFQEVKKKVAEKQAENIGLLTKHNDKEFPTNGGIILFGKIVTIFP